jgi:hypothetical protein
MSNIRVKIKTESTVRSDIYKRVVQIFLNDKFIGTVESFYKNEILMIPNLWWGDKNLNHYNYFYHASTANGMHRNSFNSVNEAIQWVVYTHNLWWGDKNLIDFYHRDKNLKESSNPIYTFFDEIQKSSIVDWADEVKRTNVYSKGELIGTVTHIYKDKSLILPPEWDDFYKVKTKYESDYMFFDSKAKAIKYIVEKNKEYGDLDIEEIDEQLEFNSEQFIITHETEHLNKDYWGFLGFWSDTRKTFFLHLSDGFYLGQVKSYYKNGTLVMPAGWNNYYKVVTKDDDYELVDSNAKGIKFIIDQYNMRKRLGENKNQAEPEVTIYVETVPTPEDIHTQMHKIVNIFFKGNKIGYVHYMFNKYNELQKFYDNPRDKGHYYRYFVTKTHGLEQLRNACGHTNSLNEAIQEVIVKYKHAVGFEDEQNF